MTEQLEAAAVGSYDQFGLFPALSSKVADVNSPDDDSTTYLLDYVGNHRQSFTLEASAIPAGSTINSVTIHGRLATSEGANGNYVFMFLRLGGTNVDGPAHDVHPIYIPDWRDFNDTLARPGGGAWTLADLATLEIGVGVAVPNFWADCTTLYAVVDYTPGGGPTPSGNMLLCMA